MGILVVGKALLKVAHVEVKALIDDGAVGEYGWYKAV